MSILFHLCRASMKLHAAAVLSINWHFSKTLYDHAFNLVRPFVAFDGCVRGQPVSFHNWWGIAIQATTALESHTSSSSSGRSRTAPPPNILLRRHIPPKTGMAFQYHDLRTVLGAHCLMYCFLATPSPPHVGLLLVVPFFAGDASWGREVLFL
jgi:hypothetical protein